MTPIAWTYAESDPALMLWTAALRAWDLRWPCAAPHVLELGCAETDWLERMSRANPFARFTGVDVRWPRDPHGWTWVQGDAARPDLFAPESFDVVVLLGALEHFGLGFYGDPPCEEGDYPDDAERRPVAAARRLGVRRRAV